MPIPSFKLTRKDSPQRRSRGWIAATSTLSTAIREFRIRLGPRVIKLDGEIVGPPVTRLDRDDGGPQYSDWCDFEIEEPRPG